MEEYSKLKILLCGPIEDDKSSLLHRVIKSRFQSNYKSTVGVNILTKEVEIEKGLIAVLSLWDISEDNQFDIVRSTFYKDANGAILIFNPLRINQ